MRKIFSKVKIGLRLTRASERFSTTTRVEAIADSTSSEMASIDPIDIDALFIEFAVVVTVADLSVRPNSYDQ